MPIWSTQENSRYKVSRVAEFYADFKFVDIKVPKNVIDKNDAKSIVYIYKVFWITDHGLINELIVFSSTVQHRPWIEYNILNISFSASVCMYSFFSPATVFLVTEIIPGLHDTSIYNTRGKSSLFSCDTYVQLNRTKICNSSLWQNFHLFRRKNSMCGL